MSHIMIKKNIETNNIVPNLLADNLGSQYSKQVPASQKKELGQFFTPIPIAKLMSSYSTFRGESVSILDPGCGTAVLSCSLIEFLVEQNEHIRKVELTAYETDSDAAELANSVLIYLNQWLLDKGISFSYNLKNADFILDNSISLRTKSSLKFDVIISNPPYFKMAKDDSRVLASTELISGQSNMYSLFMGIASMMLKDNGEMIFITPRSFASGGYFRAFREFLFNSVKLERVHLFDSRTDTFQKDKVLQELVITKMRKRNIGGNEQVLLSSCRGLYDIDSPTIKSYPIDKLINLNTTEKILHLPSNEKDECVLSLVATWTHSLSDYDIQISTGKVVSFRSLQYIQETYNQKEKLAPLFWLHNVNKMQLEWPLTQAGKGQYIRDNTNSKSILIPNRNYILLRRFSTKDDKSRLIAAPYFCNHTTAENIGVENKVNYIYRKKGHLDRSEVAGLCGLLNSTLFDTYFQIFNGNVNVSATELREMKLPKIEDIKTIGNKIILSNDYSMSNVNYIVNEYFKMQITLS